MAGELGEAVASWDGGGLGGGEFAVLVGVAADDAPV